MRWLVWSLWCTALVACDAPQVVLDDQTCETICACFASPLPAEQEQCVSSCLQSITPVSNACASCVERNAHQCLQLDAECESICTGSSPPQEFVDAGGMP